MVFSFRFSFDNVCIEMDVTPFFFTCNPTIFFFSICFFSFGNPFRLVWMVPIQVIFLLCSHLANGIEVKYQSIYILEPLKGWWFCLYPLTIRFTRVSDIRGSN